MFDFRALPHPDLHRRADHGLRDLVRDVRAVPLPAALPRERARLLRGQDGRDLPAALARLVRRRADRRKAVGADARADPARRRARARRRRAAADDGITLARPWTTLLPGFIVGGIGIGLVNAPLASTAVSVVEPRRAGMASGINNTFRQVGIATGIAALGAIFQSRIASHLAASARPRTASASRCLVGRHAQVRSHSGALRAQSRDARALGVHPAA